MQLFSLIQKKVQAKSFKTAAIFTSGNIIVAIIGAVSGILYGRWIEPEVLGSFNKYGILTGYLCLGIVFVDSAFRRHFPVYLGKGQEQKARDVAGFAKWWYLALMWAGLALFSILSFESALAGNWNATAGWIAQIPIYSIATFGLYLKILYRSNDDFLKLNKNMLVTAGAGLFFLPLVYFFKFYGLAARSILQNIINLYTHIRNAPFQIKAKFSKKELFKLAKVSLPIQIPVYLDSHLLKATVSLVILHYLGEKELGIYAMAIMLQGFLMVFSSSLNQIFITKIMLFYGKHDDLAVTFRYIMRPVLLASSLGLLIVITFGFIIGPVIEYMLPKYILVIPVVQILAYEMFFVLVRSPFSLFVSALMYKELIVIRVVKSALTLGLIFIFNNNLKTIAFVIVGASFIHAIAGYMLLLYKINRQKTASIGHH